MATTQFVIGDVVKFRLTLNAAKFFIGEIVGVCKPTFSLSIKPSESAKKKLHSFINSDGTIPIQFRCCELKSKKAAEELRIRIKREKFARARHEEKMREEAQWRRLRELAAKTSPQQNKNKKKKTKSKTWTYSPN